MKVSAIQFKDDAFEFNGWDRCADKLSSTEKHPALALPAALRLLASWNKIHLVIPGKRKWRGLWKGMGKEVHKEQMYVSG